MKHTRWWSEPAACLTWCGRSFLLPGAAVAPGFSLPLATTSRGVGLALIGSYYPHTFLCLTVLPPCWAETGWGSTPQPGVCRVTEGPPCRAVFKRFGSPSRLLEWREPSSPKNCQCQHLDILFQSLNTMKPQCWFLQANLRLPH